MASQKPLKFSAMGKKNLPCYYLASVNLGNTYTKMHACTHKCTYIDSPTDKRTHAHTRMYRPCTNSLAVFLSTPWRSQVTSPWSCLSVLFRTSIHPSFFFSAIRLIFVLGDCRTPCLLEIVSATSPFSSQIIAVHWLLEGVQVNLAFSPLRTVRFSGNSFI